MTTLKQLLCTSLSLFLMSSAFSQVALADPSSDLVNSVKLGEPPSLPFDYQKFQSLIAQGADVNAQDEAGESVTLLTFIAHAYLPDGSPEKALLFQALQLLIQNGADINLADNEGLTPLMMAVHRAHCCVTPPNTVPQIKPVYDLLLADTKPTPDLNYKSTFGQSALSYLAVWNEIDEMQTFLSIGADIFTVDNYGNSIFFSAIGGSPDTKTLAALLSLVPAEQQSSILSAPNFSKTTPLLEAVRSRNLPAVNLLLSQYHVDANAMNEGGETPLYAAYDLLHSPRMSDANRAKLQSIVTSLKLSGGELPLRQSEDLNCTGPNVGAMTFERLKKLIETCRLNRVDDVIPLLPIQYLSNYLLSYHPRGVQGGDFAHPRVITLGVDAKQIISFNGGGSFSGANSIETIDFNTDGAEQFEFHDIEFGNGVPQFSQKNPSTCIACHGSTPRPMWDNWYLWPGFYQSEQAALYPKERTYFAQFVAQTQSTGRYQNLLPISDAAFHTTLGINVGGALSENTRVDTEFQDLNSERIVNEIASNGVLWPYRYAVLAALSCNDAVQNYIPVSLQGMFPQSESTLLADTEAKDYQEFSARVQRQLSNLSITLPQGSYSQGFLMGTQTTGQSYQNQRVSRVRYVLENLGQSMDWSMVFSPEANTYVLPEMVRVEVKLWRRLLSDAKEDQEVLTLFGQQSAKLSAFDASITDGLFRGADYNPKPAGVDNTQVCADLQALSQKALGQ